MKKINNIENANRKLYKRLINEVYGSKAEDRKTNDKENENVSSARAYYDIVFGKDERTSIIIRSYSDFMTEKRKGTFKNLRDGMEIYLPKTPLLFAFLTELKLLYDTHGLLAYFLDIRDDYIVIALRED